MERIAHTEAPAPSDGEQATRIRPDPLPAPAPAQTKPSIIIEQKPEPSGHRAPDIRVSERPARKLPPNVYRFAPKTPSSAISADWFRYELDIRPLKTKAGYKVVVRKRLRWSKTRHSRTVTVNRCPDLHAASVKQIHAGKLTNAALAAFEQGGISNEITKELTSRPGRGHGRKAKDLTDNERLILARLERLLAADEDGGTAHAGA